MSSKRFYEKQIERYQRALERLERYPEKDPYPEGTVVTFTLELSRGNYDYAAIRKRGRWYTTGVGDPQGGRSWSQFVEWLGDRATDLVVMVPADGQMAPVPSVEDRIRDLIEIARTDPDVLDRALGTFGMGTAQASEEPSCTGMVPDKEIRFYDESSERGL